MVSQHLNLQIHDNLLTPEECTDLLRVGREIGYLASHVLEAGTSIEHHGRTSTSCAIPVGYNPAVETVEKRMADLFGVPVSYLEPLQLVRYTTNQEYRPHFDAFEVPSSMGQRVFTALAYLQCPDNGGATVFPRVQQQVEPQVGRVVTWRNVGKDNLRLLDSEHGGLPVFSGEKIALNIWVRDRPYR